MPAMRLMWTPPQAKVKKTPLPANFVPQPYSVLIGRGKACTNAIGNRRLQVLASSYLEDYNNASTKMEKSVIVSKIVDSIREACPVGAFIRHEGGRWWEVDDVSAREKVGTMIRDLLSNKYRSSSKAKVARRKKRKQDSSPTGTTSVVDSILELWSLDFPVDPELQMLNDANEMKPIPLTASSSTDFIFINDWEELS
eukprot:scaffold8060_cov110-Cylindrotheca_fusiformis.AAC.5